MLRSPNAPSGIATSPSDNVLSLRSSITYRFLLDLCAPLLSSAITWLDAALRLHVKRATAPGNDLPGLSVSRATIESLLLDLSGEPDTELVSAQAAEQMALREVLRICAEANAHDDALADLCRGFAFTSLEIRAFLLCLAPELDAKYQRIFGIVSLLPTTRPPTVTTRCVRIPARTIALRLPNTHATRASGNGSSRWVTNWPGFGPAFKFCLRNCMSS
jgi:hypothetical protein